MSSRFVNSFFYGPQLLVLCGLLLICTTVHAQTTVKMVDSLFSKLAGDHEFNGNVAIAVQGNLIYGASFGFANADEQRLNTMNTRFYLASVSKIFTAVAILQLNQKGKIKLDDPFYRYFSDFPWRQITIRQLLSHTSGLPDYQMLEGPYSKNTDTIFSNKDLILAMRADERGLLFVPGERFSYSNTGYGLLALLVEKISGKQFSEYLRKHIFQPAGMINTYVYSSLSPVTDKGRAMRYDPVTYAPGQLRLADSLKSDLDIRTLAGILGPTGVVSTTGDLLKFDEALYGTILLKPKMLAEAFRPVKLNNGTLAETGWKNTKSYYGLGWMILQDTTCGKIVWHSGGSAGTVTALIRDISRRQTLIVLDNVTHRNLHSEAISALNLLNRHPVSPQIRSLAVLYIQTLHAKGSDAAVVAFNQCKADTAHYYLDERELNRLAFHLNNDGFKTEALEALKLNTLLYPNSFNTYDSYAFLLALSGRTTDAVLMYRKSLELNSKNAGGRKALDDLLKSERAKIN